MKNIGCISRNDEIISDLKENCECGILEYRSAESLKRDNISLLLIDYSIFDSPENVQFQLSRIRKKIHTIPVMIIITVSHLENIQVEWFFEDFIVYPFRRGEVGSRVNRLLKSYDTGDDLIHVGPLTINLREYAVFMNDEKIELTYKEFEMLRLLVENRGTVFSRQDLLSRIWGIDYIGGTRTVDVHIRRLRGKLGDQFTSLIETVRNVGYRCREE